MATGYKFPILNSDGSISTKSTVGYPYGALFNWGYNSNGQLGNGTIVNYSSPIQIGALTSWSQISHGNLYFAAIKIDGTLWTCGYNSRGQLGNNSSGFTLKYSSPIQVGSLTNWSQVKGGNSHTIAIKTDGTLWTWGYNFDGELGNGNNTNYSSPIQIGLLTNWSKISSGSYHNAAIKTDGSLWSWGHGDQGRLGNGTVTIRYSSPVQIGALTNWSQVSCGYRYTSAVKNDGTLWAWGENAYGQLGNGATNDYSSPIQIGSLTNWKQVSCGYRHTSAVKTDGTLWAWGWNDKGQLGNGTVNVYYSSPIQIGSLTNWSQLSSSYANIRSIKTDGSIWIWGRGDSGSIGNDTGFINYSSPIQIGSFTNWYSLSEGVSQNHGAIASQFQSSATIVDIEDMFIFKDQFLTAGLWGWGAGNFGRIGNGTTIHYSSPVQIGSLTNWKQVSCGYHSGVIKTDGTLWTWGYNNYGQLGNGTVSNSSSPIQIGLLANWKQVSCTGSYGRPHTLAIKVDGTLWAWGGNDSGQLGNGTNSNDYSSPIQIGALTNWKQVSTGGNNVTQHSAAIKTDNTLWTWGYNDKGQLGNGTTSYGYSSPIQIGSLNNWKQVSCGYRATSAIKTDGTLWTWGYNAAGQLGNSTIVDYSSPIQVGSLSSWKQIFIYYHTSAIRNDGTLWTWGNNGYGQLGNGTSINYSSPIQVGSLTNWKQVSAGFLYTSAIKADNTLWSWGHNTYGQLGNGTGVYYSSPIQVGSLTNWKQIACGIYTAVAIQSPDLP